ncbi:NAD(P)/FAD-dependent oxidoreductase [Spirillospora sp. CA-294931]|uniref:NAD(P)/FAD-dependent oxidoreductase n=1 Tax=Spirillospora sp. CA-294931 TaxID=3240042 RepID=UPI003D89BCD4
MSERNPSTNRYDVVVVGGGAAGLSGALTLGRARRSVLVVDGGRPRNAPAAQIHGYLGHDGTPPAELLARGRAEVARYGGQVIDGDVVTAEALPGGGFRVVLDDGRHAEAGRLLVTTGLTDELPDIPGLAERWGRDVIHCPYCHGYEVRDEPIAVLATGPLAARKALLWRQWSDQVTLFTHTDPAPGAEDLERLAARDVTVVEGKVTEVRITGDRIGGLALADGRVIPCRVVAAAPLFTARAGFLRALGLRAADVEMGGHVMGRHIPAGPGGATDVPGVWVAGNVTDLMAQVVGAADGGSRAAAAINNDIIDEEARMAVARTKKETR